jgi:hypothetical protein
VDALLRLLKIKESVDDPAIAKKIAQILIPREYTRVDGIIDVVFSAAEEGTTQLETDEDEHEATSRNGKKFVPVKFHEACVTRLEKHLRQTLVRQTRSTYATPDGDIALVCSISRQHEDTNRRNHWYWFAFHPYYKDFLANRKQASVAFACGSPDLILLVPSPDFHSWLDGLNMTRRDESFYWHVKIHEASNKLVLHRKSGFAPIELQKFRI